MFRLLICLCLLTMVPGLLIRIPFGGGGILLSDIMLPLFAATWLSWKFFYQRSWPRISWWWPSVTFALVALVSWFLGAWELDLKAKILSFSYLIRFISIIVLAWAVYDDVRQRGGADTYFKFLFGIVGVIIVLGYLQFFVVPDIGKWSTAGGFDPHTGRLLGTWMDPNFIGGLLAFFLPVMCGYWYQSLEVRSSGLGVRVWVGLLIVLCLGAAFFTFSRSGYLSIAGGLGLFFLLRDPKLILVAILLVMIGLGTNQRAQQRVGELAGTMASIVLGHTAEIDATAKLRIQSWGKSLVLWEKYPVLGIGYNTYRYRAAEEGIVDESYFSAGGSDSTLLTILVTTGIFGFLAFCWFYVHFWWRHWWQYWRGGSTLALGFVAGWSAILVHSVFVNSFLFPLIFMPMLVVAAVLEATEQRPN